MPNLQQYYISTEELEDVFAAATQITVNEV